MSKSSKIFDKGRFIGELNKFDIYATFEKLKMSGFSKRKSFK